MLALDSLIGIFHVDAQSDIVFAFRNNTMGDIHSGGPTAGSIMSLLNIGDLTLTSAGFSDPLFLLKLVF